MDSEIVLSPTELRKLKPALVFKHCERDINAIDISPNGKYMVVSANDNSINYYDLDRGTKVNTYYSKKQGCKDVKFTHHHKTILCSSNTEGEYNIMYWSLHDNKILSYFKGHTDCIVGLEVSPLSNLFLSFAKNNETRLWNYDTEECVATFDET